MNPQYYPPDLDLTDYVGLSENDLKARLISNEVENLLASLDGDGVEDQLDLVDLKTTLKPHQRVALHFIAQRESQRYCRKLEAELRLLMNLPTVDKTMYPATGGILADVMGLGKTLTMLCTIVRTREQATNYRVSQSRFKTDDKSLCVTEATLVIVTSIQVLDVWTKELQTHFRDGTLNTISFHGQRRTKDPTKLTGQHLVLTTYGTLVADSKGPKVLEKMAWYRIILDEAPSVESPFAPSPLGDVEMTDVTEGTVAASVDSTLNSGVRSSSKIEAVLENLANSDHNSKSLVFSYWTTTLDLLRTRLEGLRLPCLQIDGRVGYSERRSILERFRRPEGPAILLMSIKTGAVGLNITAANRIHIVEPQWNPSVEQQAIARVLRMGQQRQVTIIRYIVEKTVEEVRTTNP
ncbi:hypothetical protein E8E14_000164 [Neopestalotiopsis sp. 37M]|nr:hypothetical protein E8E14_000164 [Neopestalotiopsis sp. 37M]